MVRVDLSENTHDFIYTINESWLGSRPHPFRKFPGELFLIKDAELPGGEFDELVVLIALVETVGVPAGDDKGYYGDQKVFAGHNSHIVM